MSRTWWSILAGIVGVCIIADVFAPHEGDAWYLIPGFYSIFGFVGTLIITYFSKTLGRMLLQKKEDYYNGR